MKTFEQKEQIIRKVVFGHPDWTTRELLILLADKHDINLAACQNARLHDYFCEIIKR